VALADGEKHGYAILKDVARRTGGQGSPKRGNALRQSSASGKRRSYRGIRAQAGTGVGRRARRYYLLTEFGRAVAVAEAERMEEALVQARAKKLFRKAKLA